MNRRELLTGLMATPLGIVAEIGAEKPPPDVPVIKFSSACAISNLDDIFKNVQWKKISYFDSEQKIQETIAWLPEDRAINYYEQKNKKLFYGIVKVKRHHRYFKDCDWISRPMIERLPESFQKDHEHDDIFLQLL